MEQSLKEILRYYVASLLFHFMLSGFLIAFGFILIAKTEWMLDLTQTIERWMGAMWIPTEFTAQVFRVLGILCLASGSYLLGYTIAIH